MDNNKNKKKKKKEITESVPESEFNLSMKSLQTNSNRVENTQEISMEDLMGTLNDVTGLKYVLRLVFVNCAAM